MYKRTANWLVLFLINYLSFGSADEYMKRELSLIKPYHGEHGLAISELIMKHVSVNRF